MKNIVSFLFVICLLGFGSFSSSKENKIFTIFKQGQCEFVVSNTTNISFLPKEAAIISHGQDTIVKVNSSISRYVYERIGKENIKGIVFKFEGKFEDLKAELNFKHFKDKENHNQYYGFTNVFDDFAFVAGKKVNIHIVQNQNMLVVGFPIILTSY